MYAVIETGGKQYIVAPGKVIYVEKFQHLKDHPIEFKGICLKNNQLKEDKNQAQAIKTATIIAKPMDTIRTPKVLIFKKKRRHNYRRKKGHRQTLLPLQIEQVVVHE